MAILSPSAAAVLCPFTLGYMAAAGWIYWYRRKRVLGGLVEFSSQYAWIQKQLLEEILWFIFFFPEFWCFWLEFVRFCFALLLFVCLFFQFFETGFLCVALAVLEFTL